MGAGSYTAGSGMAGLDQVSPAVQVPADALSTAYDPRTRTIPVDAAGVIGTAHWVDQSMSLCLTVAKGSIAAAPDIGVDRDRLALATELNAPSVVEAVVLDAIAHLTRINAVEILRIETFWSPGRLGYAVSYKNLLAPSSETQKVEG